MIYFLIDKLVITKHKGKYWIYWGENHVYAATSDNLVDWAPVLNEKGELLELVSPRKGYFDSHLTECGPPAVPTRASDRRADVRRVRVTASAIPGQIPGLHPAPTAHAGLVAWVVPVAFGVFEQDHQGLQRRMDHGHSRVHSV